MKVGNRIDEIVFRVALSAVLGLEAIRFVLMLIVETFRQLFSGFGG